QCVLCELYPKSFYGYMQHLREHHESTLSKERICLICSCGHRVDSDHSYRKHDKKCNGRAFTLHKLTASTPQCVLCEAHPKTPYGYTSHLRVRHATTLLVSGVYLMCSCGFRICSENSHKKHDNELCNGDDFTLHKLGEN
ncbi:hypothetical protein PMAYCL1PPCAC_01201, partial [Pristionchus mayeri]